MNVCVETMHELVNMACHVKRFERSISLEKRDVSAVQLTFIHLPSNLNSLMFLTLN